MLFTGDEPSQKYQLSKADLLHILKVLGYSAASAIVATLISIIPQIDLPAKYLWLGALVPIINTGLVAAQKFFTDHI